MYFRKKIYECYVKRPIKHEKTEEGPKDIKKSQTEVYKISIRKIPTP